MNSEEKDRWSAYQLLQHSFISPPVTVALSNGTSKAMEGAAATASNGCVIPINNPEPQEPIPDFCFFTGVAGKSRIKSEFEQLQFLGKGGFGNVIKVSICMWPSQSQQAITFDAYVTT